MTIGCIESVTTGLINIIRTDLATITPNFRIVVGYPHEASQIPFSVYVNVIDMSHEEFGQGQRYKTNLIQKRKLLVRISCWTPKIKDDSYSINVLDDFENITDWTATNSTLSLITGSFEGSYCMSIKSTTAKPLGGTWLKATKTFTTPVQINMFTKFNIYTKKITPALHGLQIWLIDDVSTPLILCSIPIASWAKETNDITTITNIKTIEIYYDSAFAVDDEVLVDYFYLDTQIVEQQYLDRILDRIQRLLITERDLNMTYVSDVQLRGISPLLFDESLNAFNKTMSYEIEFEELI